jgi:multimeric flavodoxin WrbA
MKNVLVIETSPRKGGNSDQLAEQFAEGVTMPKDISGHAALKQAYEFGKSI